jgi:hypothetical protein
MSVWLACREVLAHDKKGLTGSELRIHANHLQDLDRTLSHEFLQGERQAVATQDSLLDLERELSAANDQLSEHLMTGGAANAIEVKDSEAFARELAQFKSRQIERARIARSRTGQ